MSTPPATALRPLDAGDPLDLADELTEQERAVRDRVRAWVDARVRPRVAEDYERGHWPREYVREDGELGVLGMHLEGASAVQYGLACQELEAGDSGLRTVVSVAGSLVMTAIHRFGSEEQQAHWLADVAVVWAGTDEGTRGFLVPTHLPGFPARDITDKLSLRASVQSELTFEGVRLPGDAVLPDAHGLRGPFTSLNEARYGIIWGVMGAARDCFLTALRYAGEREQFGRPLSGFQLTQEKLANMAVELGKGQLLALHLGRMKDAGRLRNEQVSVGKLNNVREALAIARTARTVLGGEGVRGAFPIMRHMANLESVMTYEGTSEVHTLVLGHALTGEKAFA